MTHLLVALQIRTVSHRPAALPTVEQIMWTQTIACVGFTQWRKTSGADVVSLRAAGHRADGAWTRSVTGLLRGDFITSTCLSGRVRRWPGTNWNNNFLPPRLKWDVRQKFDTSAYFTSVRFSLQTGWSFRQSGKVGHKSVDTLSAVWSHMISKWGAINYPRLIELSVLSLSISTYWTLLDKLIAVICHLWHLGWKREASSLKPHAVNAWLSSEDILSPVSCWVEERELRSNHLVLRRRLIPVTCCFNGLVLMDVGSWIHTDGFEILSSE